MNNKGIQNIFLMRRFGAVVHTTQRQRLASNRLPMKINWWWWRWQVFSYPISGFCDEWTWQSNEEKIWCQSFILKGAFIFQFFWRCNGQCVQEMYDDSTVPGEANSSSHFRNIPRLLFHCSRTVSIALSGCRSLRHAAKSHTSYTEVVFITDSTEVNTLSHGCFLSVSMCHVRRGSSVSPNIWRTSWNTFCYHLNSKCQHQDYCKWESLVIAYFFVEHSALKNSYVRYLRITHTISPLTFLLYLQGWFTSLNNCLPWPGRISSQRWPVSRGSTCKEPPSCEGDKLWPKNAH